MSKRNEKPWIGLLLVLPLIVGALPGCGGTEESVAGLSQALGADDEDRDEGRGGAVYAMTNAQGDNAIVAYRRFADGILELAGAPVKTGGGGSGVQRDPTDSLGSQGGLFLDRRHRLLFAVNTETGTSAPDCSQGSISVLRIGENGDLRRIGRPVPSGGLYPDSLAVHGGVLYVLNAGGPAACTPAPGFAPNPNVTGFRIEKDGDLERLPRSTHFIDPGSGSDCQPPLPPCGLNPPAFPRSPGQVSFGPSGNQLFVTVKSTNSVYVFPVRDHGGLGAPTITRAPMPERPTKFGFGFDHRGHLIVSEPFGRASTIPQPHVSTVTSLEIMQDGSLRPIGDPVPNGQTTSCWVAMEPHHQRHAYIANNGSNNLSVYDVSEDGHLTHEVGAEQELGDGAHPNDLAVVKQGQRAYLYSLNSGNGTVGTFLIQPDGRLAPLGPIGGISPNAGAQGLVAY